MMKWLLRWMSIDVMRPPPVLVIVCGTPAGTTMIYPAMAMQLRSPAGWAIKEEERDRDAAGASALELEGVAHVGQGGECDRLHRGSAAQARIAVEAARIRERVNGGRGWIATPMAAGSGLLAASSQLSLRRGRGR
jgi:hypothetical protein